MKKIAIIGATGRVGFRLCLAFHNDYSVVAVGRNPTKKDFSKYSNIDFIQISNLSETDKLAIALKDCDAIINAGYIWLAEDIYKAMNAGGCKASHIIFTGSAGMFTKLDNYSAELKRMAEKFIEENFSINWTIIRPTMIYGVREDNNISRIIKLFNRTRIFPLIGKGENLIQPVYIYDLVTSFKIALFNSKMFNKAFNIGGAKAVTNKQLFRIIGKALNKKVNFLYIHPSLISIMVKILKPFKLNPISEEQILRFQEDKNIDLVPFINQFGFTPLDFETGVTKMVKDLENSQSKN
ncbi:MAG: NAD(P)H-binding protein [Bacteroidetes bacterium]|nr:NAD(P)H-binding protein [Bacteroidota bacterium]